MSYFDAGFWSHRRAASRVVEFAYTYQGNILYFSSEKNMNTFSYDPTKYMPSGGGYCPLAMSGLDPALSWVCTSVSPVDPLSYEVDTQGRLWLYREPALYSMAEKCMRDWLDSGVGGVSPYSQAQANWANLVAQRTGTGELYPPAMMNKNTKHGPPRALKSDQDRRCRGWVVEPCVGLVRRRRGLAPYARGRVSLSVRTAAAGVPSLITAGRQWALGPWQSPRPTPGEKVGLNHGRRVPLGPRKCLTRTHRPLARLCFESSKPALLANAPISALDARTSCNRFIGPRFSRDSARIASCGRASAWRPTAAIHLKRVRRRRGATHPAPCFRQPRPTCSTEYGQPVPASGPCRRWKKRRPRKHARGGKGGRATRLFMTHAGKWTTATGLRRS